MKNSTYNLKTLYTQKPKKKEKKNTFRKQERALQMVRKQLTIIPSYNIFEF